MTTETESKTSPDELCLGCGQATRTKDDLGYWENHCTIHDGKPIEEIEKIFKYHQYREAIIQYYKELHDDRESLKQKEAANALFDEYISPIVKPLEKPQFTTQEPTDALLYEFTHTECGYHVETRILRDCPNCHKPLFTKEGRTLPMNLNDIGITINLILHKIGQVESNIRTLDDRYKNHYHLQEPESRPIAG